MPNNVDKSNKCHTPKWSQSRLLPLLSELDTRRRYASGSSGG